ncbi:MAG: ribonuclease III [Caldilineaceae bacterium]|nr:ribonuclease III [Caldilineaceae bacterium]
MTNPQGEPSKDGGDPDFDAFGVTPLPLDQLIAAIEVEFDDPSVLREAFIHRSYVNELADPASLVDNERLELLGDSVLSFVVIDELFRRFPKEQEGELTRLRSALVRKEMLAKVARTLGLGQYLLLGKGDEDSGGRDRTATLCDVFEALVGAIYLARGIPAARDFIMRVLEPELEYVIKYDLSKDAKSRMQEYVQSTYGRTPRYSNEDSFGPDHNKLFVQVVTVQKVRVGIGRGASKQEAEQAAAAMALHRFGEAAPEYLPDPELEQAYQLDDVDSLRPLT